MICFFALLSLFIMASGLLAMSIDNGKLSWEWILAFACLSKFASTGPFMLLYLYTAEALCLLNRPGEAAQHLAPNIVPANSANANGASSAVLHRYTNCQVTRFGVCLRVP